MLLKKKGDICDWLIVEDNAYDWLLCLTHLLIGDICIDNVLYPVGHVIHILLSQKLFISFGSLKKIRVVTLVFLDSSSFISIQSIRLSSVFYFIAVKMYCKACKLVQEVGRV